MAGLFRIFSEMSKKCRGMEPAKKFSTAIPRYMYRSTQLTNSEVCPCCGKKLENEVYTYLVFIKTKFGIEQQIMGVDGGYFCSNCPIIVLDMEKFKTIVRTNYPDTSFEFLVAGYLDLSAIDKEKMEQGLGTEDNPIPLVPFKNFKFPKSWRRSGFILPKVQCKFIKEF